MSHIMNYYKAHEISRSAFALMRENAKIADREKLAFRKSIENLLLNTPDLTAREIATQLAEQEEEIPIIIRHIVAMGRQESVLAGYQIVAIHRNRIRHFAELDNCGNVIELFDKEERLPCLYRLRKPKLRDF